MIHIKSEKELERMRVAGRITALARKAAADAVHPGVTTEEIDRIVRKTIEDAGAKPSFLGYGGFPGSACVSINDEVIHGIPSKTHIVREGDIVTAINGQAVGSIDDLNTIKNQYAAGDEVTLTVYRSGTYYEITVTLVDQATGK